LLIRQSGGGTPCRARAERREAAGAGRELHLSSLIVLILRLTKRSTISLLLVLVVLMLVPAFHGAKTYVEMVGRAGAS